MHKSFKKYHFNMISIKCNINSIMLKFIYISKRSKASTDENWRKIDEIKYCNVNDKSKQYFSLLKNIDTYFNNNQK